MNAIVLHYHHLKYHKNISKTYKMSIVFFTELSGFVSLHI